MYQNRCITGKLDNNFSQDKIGETELLHLDKTVMG